MLSKGDSESGIETLAADLTSNTHMSEGGKSPATVVEGLPAIKHDDSMTTEVDDKDPSDSVPIDSPGAKADAEGADIKSIVEETIAPSTSDTTVSAASPPVPAPLEQDPKVDAFLQINAELLRYVC
jgi:hypothetical protein